MYCGADAVYEFWEDDGESTDYATSPATAVSLLDLKWSDATGCLSWTKTGSFSGPHSFEQLSVTAFLPSGATKTAPAQAIGQSGKVCPT